MSAAAPFSIGVRLAEATEGLRAAGIEAPRREARLLLAQVVEGGLQRIIGYPEQPMSAVEQARFAELLARRARREPVARILGRREFWSLDFALGPDTLEPRADSETLVAAVLERASGREAPLSLLDLGTGTGCLLLALLSEWPAASGLGLDLSAGAVAVAAANAQRLGLAGRARFRVGDWRMSDWTAGLEQRFDVIVSNPPYIETEAIAGLAPEVAGYDPRAALDGGADGLDAYRRIVPVLPGLLAPGGWVALEIGIGQEGAVGRLLEAAGFAAGETAADLAGICRCLLARTNPD